MFVNPYVNSKNINNYENACLLVGQKLSLLCMLCLLMYHFLFRSHFCNSVTAF